jgi:hypothetical protein
MCSHTMTRSLNTKEKKDLKENESEVAIIDFDEIERE